MARKVFEVLFNINGALSDGLKNAFASATNSFKNLSRMSASLSTPMKNLQSQMAGFNQKLADITKFKNLNASIRENSAALVQARLRTAQLSQEYQNQKRQTEQMRKSFQRLKDVYKDNKSSMTADQRATFQDQIRAAQSELRDQVQRQRTAGQNVETSRIDSGRLQQQLRSQQAALATLRSSMSSAGVNISQLAAEESRLRSEIERTNQAIERQAQINQHRQNFQNASSNLSNSFNNFQNSIDTARTLTSPFTSAIEEAKNFEKTMSKLKSISQMDFMRSGDLQTVQQNMAALSAQAKDLGAKTIFTAQQVGEGQIFMAKTGMDTQNILAATPPLLKLSAAADMDMAQATDIATNIMMAFGHITKDVDQNAKNFAHDTDVLAYTITHSNSDLTQLGYAMKFAAPVAKMFGSSIEETATMLGFMHDAGVQSSSAGTSLRQTMLRMMAPPKKATKAMEENGLAVADCMKEWQNAIDTAAEYGITLDTTLRPGKQMASIIRQIDKNMAGMSDHEKMAAFNAITGINAVSGATNMFNRGSKALEEMTTALENSDGTLETMYKAMTDNTWGAEESFNSAWQAMSQSVGEIFLPMVTQAFQKAAELAQSFNNFVQANPQVVQAFAAIAAGISAVIVAGAGLNVVTSAISFASTGFTMLGDKATTAFARISTAMSGFSITSLFNPMTAAVIAFALAGYYVYTHWAQVQPIFQSLADTVGGALSNAFNQVSAAFANFGVTVSNLAPAFSNIGGVIFGVLATIANFAAGIFATVISTLGSAISAIINVFGNLGNALSALLAADFSKAGEYLKNAIVSGFEGAINTIKSMVGGLFDTFANFFKPVELLANAPAAAPTPTAPPAPEVPPIDTTQTQAQVDNLGTSSDNAANSFNNIITAAQGTNDGLAQFTTSLQQPTGGLQVLSDSSSSAASAISGLGSSASAASAISGLGSSASAAISAMNAAAASASAAASAAASKPAANALGGIYNRGAFLTWFAEKSPEAAIPLDKSPRAYNLFQKVGEILGIFPKNSPPTFDRTPQKSAQPQFDDLGNIIGLDGLPDNIITKDDDIQVTNAKKAAQLEEFRKKSFHVKSNSLPKLPNSFENFSHTLTFPQNLPTPQAPRSIFSQPIQDNSPGILPQLLTATSHKDFDSSSPLDLHFEINIQGNANANDIQNGITQTIPMLEDVFAKNFANYQHEKQRTSFS